jgi:hypothetical protein
LFVHDASDELTSNIKGQIFTAHADQDTFNCIKSADDGAKYTPVDKPLISLFNEVGIEGLRKHDELELRGDEAEDRERKTVYYCGEECEDSQYFWCVVGHNATPANTIWLWNILELLDFFKVIQMDNLILSGCL